MAKGYLQMDVVSDANNFPVADAEISISRTEEPDQVLEQIFTNSSGQTENVALDAPPVELSLTPTNDVRPYAEYTVRITAPGFEPVVISGTEILADATAIQGVRMIPLEDSEGQREEDIVIPDHTLYGTFPPKIAESEIKPVAESGEIVLSRVVVPQTVVVHDGVPTNAAARNYYVPYRDYIKNVASSEIYATWPQATITANVLAIMSFTLNRVYTEWYRNHQLFVVRRGLYLIRWIFVWMKNKYHKIKRWTSRFGLVFFDTIRRNVLASLKCSGGTVLEYDTIFSR